MTVTTQAKPTRRTPKAAAEDVAPITPPPKLRRRPLLVVASAAAVCLGALLGAWAYLSVTTAQEVVAVRSSVPRGAVIDRDDLVRVRIGVDPALSTVPGDQLDSLIGQRAAVDLPAGGLVTRDSVSTAVIPAAGLSIVGVAVPAGLLPGEPLQAGDRVRVVATPGEQGEVDEGEQRSIAATVVAVHPDESSGQTVVSVQVPFDEAAELAARVATGRVVVVLDSRER